ncbi:MAG: hypothetical protein K6E68_06245 [Lachnospiraceae bacterium]|nr:hypothetical protein [Lachnospiraceae bacterium]
MKTKRILAAVLAATTIFGISLTAVANTPMSLDIGLDVNEHPVNPDSNVTDNQNNPPSHVSAGTDMPVPQDPPKSEVESLEEQRPRTSDVVDGVKSTTRGVNLATVLNGFAVAAPVQPAKTLDKGEVPFTKVYNFDAKRSTAAKAVIDTVAAGAGLTVGKTINFEMGTVKGGKYTPAEASGKITESVPVKLGAAGGYTGAIQLSANGVNILEDQDTNSNTVSINVAPVRSVIALVK